MDHPTFVPFSAINYKYVTDETLFITTFTLLSGLRVSLRFLGLNNYEVNYLFLRLSCLFISVKGLFTCSQSCIWDRDTEDSRTSPLFGGKRRRRWYNVTSFFPPLLSSSLLHFLGSTVVPRLLHVHDFYVE